jgi:hypothetical protein
MILSKTYGLQNETRQYLRRLYAYGRELAPTDVADVDNFVKGLKQLNLWGQIVCWPMRSIHNIGTGSTVLSLGGLRDYDYTGTLTNSPVWDSTGIIFTYNSAQSMTLKSFRYPTYPTFFSGIKFDPSVATNINLYGGNVANISSPVSFTLRISNINGRSFRTFNSITNDDLIFNTTYDTSHRTMTLWNNGSTKAVHTNQTQLGIKNINWPQRNFLLTNQILIGSSTNTNFYYEGTISFHCISTVSGSLTFRDNMHNLYKTTIGKGLGLP